MNFYFNSDIKISGFKQKDESERLCFADEKFSVADINSETVYQSKFRYNS